MAHTVYSRAFALNGYVRLNGAASDWDRRRHRRWLPRATVPAGRGGSTAAAEGGDPPPPQNDSATLARVCVRCVRVCASAARVCTSVACACAPVWCARAQRRRMRSHRKRSGERVRPTRCRRCRHAAALMSMQPKRHTSRYYTQHMQPYLSAARFRAPLGLPRTPTPTNRLFRAYKTPLEVGPLPH